MNKGNCSAIPSRGVQGCGFGEKSSPKPLPQYLLAEIATNIVSNGLQLEESLQV
jgi:hypothetical protein